MEKADVLVEKFRRRLLPQPQSRDETVGLAPDWAPETGFDAPPRDAAVLIALVRRDQVLSILYTERASSLRVHSGQVAFPGGKIDPTDAGPAAAALREAKEEVDLDPADARILGYLPTYFAGTNYLITPVVAEVVPRHAFVPNPGEVQSVFEVPLSVLMRSDAFQTHRVKRRNVEHSTWKVDHPGPMIWGITANLTKHLFERVLGEGGE